MTKNEKQYASKGLIMFQDNVLSLLGSLMAILLVRWLSDPIPGYTWLLLKWLGAGLVGTIIGMLVTGSHKNVKTYISYTSAMKTSWTLLIKTIFLVVVMLVGFVKLPSISLAAMALLADFIASIFFVLYLRFSLTSLSRETGRVKDQVGKLTALVMGTGRAAVDLADEAAASGRYDVVGFLSADPAMSGMLIGNRMVYKCGNESEMKGIMQRLGGVDCILFTKNPDDGFPKDGAQEKDDPKNTVAQRDGMSLVGHVIKRGFDVILSGILLLIFSPVMLVCALAVKNEDGGPALYSQERMGRNGKPFLIYKFRSMRINAENGKPALYSGDDDERLTRVGKFLRQHHLDELPQLWNVFRGDMSFIGYRPERQFYIDQIMEKNPRYQYLYQIRPGVTSYATLYNGYTDTLEKMLTRLDLDLYYLRNHSVMFDVKVLWMTFLNIMTGKKF